MLLICKFLLIGIVVVVVVLEMFCVMCKCMFDSLMIYVYFLIEPFIV